jgi:endonuclease YncB( thermonuclease family)
MEKKGVSRTRKLILLGVLVLLLIVVDGVSLIFYLIPFSVFPQSYPVGNFRVTDVISGDTIKIDTGSYVRLIGISAPQQGQDMYQSSKNFLSLLVLNKTVRLERDTEDTDSYGQLQRYVYVDLYGKEVFVNVESVKEGFSIPMPISPNTKYKSQIQQASQECLKSKLNLCSQGL